ncbi:MAG: Gmad2 immunoglobulin-like domain-containing protein, partial [Dermatophilaceae bacterium]
AMNAQSLSNDEPYVQPWSGTTVKNVTVTPTLITISLSGPGASGFTAEQTRLAVQELVWTAQAAVGKGSIPVKFVVSGGATKLFGAYLTSLTYNRPATDQQYRDLAPIWITSPVRGQVLPAGAPVVAKGQSCAFEATTQWQLKKAGAVVKSGTTTATSGCPTRGTWQVNLGKLPAGGYTFRMYEVSMQDGQGVVAESSRPFTVK